MNRAEHLERLAETLDEAVQEMEQGEWSAKALGLTTVVGRDGEWSLIYLRLKNLRSVIRDQKQHEEQQAANRRRFDLHLYEGRTPGGRGVWVFVPLDDNGIPQYDEEFEVHGDLDNFMSTCRVNAGTVTELPNYPRFLLLP